IVMVYNLRASLLISALLPLAVLMCFIFMKYFQVDANIVALSGIAIAIGTMVDLGIILNENILKHLDEAPPGQKLITTVYNATTDVATAILTAVSTTIVSFLPVFTMEAAEGNLFGPLAYTKTFALVSALIFTILLMPAFAHAFFSIKTSRTRWSGALNGVLFLIGFAALFILPLAGFILMAVAAINLLSLYREAQFARYQDPVMVALAVLGVSWLLATEWLPLGVEVHILINFLFILLIIGLVLGFFTVFIKIYPKILTWCLEHKATFLLIPVVLILLALNIWLGFNNVFGFIPKAFDKVNVNIRTSSPWSAMVHTFPGLGDEFMPSLDEGAFLLMPTAMPHAGVEANKRTVQQLDLLVTNIPEVEIAVGKAGRAETALDPAPISMFENIIQYKSEFITDENGEKMRFKVDDEGMFVRDDNGELVPDKNGEYFRQWRDHIQSPDDIWEEITRVTNNLPGVTSAPKLQPIETRLVMLQTGMRAPMGIKVYGPDLKTIEAFSLQLERLLKEVPSVKKEAVFADRSLGKPYMEIDLNRRALGRYGLNVADAQEYIEVALGGMSFTTTVEGRERYSVRARYAREYRNDPEVISRTLITTASGAQIPLAEIAEINYRPGPMMIRSENSFLTGYVLFDKREGFAEVPVVEDARNYLNTKIENGELKVPAGVSFVFSGNYENQVRAEERLSLVVPLSLLIIFLILYFQFRSVATSLFIFSAIAMAFAGGFIMLWLYSQGWFMNFDFAGTNLRELFQMRTFNLSVAVWVGFIALFGIATDDGVVIGTYLTQNFEREKPDTREGVRKAVLEAG
ncbi:MAG: efflux RND transporter permease subunit, partial [Hymenobacteraceae bacterium]|nr:efflux RND transporter permease subunit [Hymenobacteraceae bacterium]MDX5396654.1 efflux RND transporter permease subunit [Hymenobacteraceae bacterium]MDX5512720.1 efflux RND transporter permease subunit [Hymenobacteraceae bacterium]